MSPHGNGRVLLPLVAAILAVAAVWLMFDNPDIDGTSRGDSYTCLAPWDTVLNGADNFPGGEPPSDGKEIAARCREAGQERFLAAVAVGSAAVVLPVVTTVLFWRRARVGVRTSA